MVGIGERRIDRVVVRGFSESQLVKYVEDSASADAIKLCCSMEDEGRVEMCTVTLGCATVPDDGEDRRQVGTITPGCATVPGEDKREAGPITPGVGRSVSDEDERESGTITPCCVTVPGEYEDREIAPITPGCATVPDEGEGRGFDVRYIGCEAGRMRRSLFDGCQLGKALLIANTTREADVSGLPFRHACLIRFLIFLGMTSHSSCVTKWAMIEI